MGSNKLKIVITSIISLVKNEMNLVTVLDAIKNDRDLVMEAVRRNGRDLEFASWDLRKDRDVVMEAVSQCGMALEFASRALQDDREIVMKAVTGPRSGSAIMYASETLRNDREIVIAAVTGDKDNLAVHHIPEIFLHDKDVMFIAVKQGFRYEYLMSNLVGDRDIVMETVKHHGLPTSTSDHAIKGLKTIMSVDGMNLYNATPQHRDNKDIVLEAVRQNGMALKYASDRLRADPEVILTAMRENRKALEYAMGDYMDAFDSLSQTHNVGRHPNSPL